MVKNTTKTIKKKRESRRPAGTTVACCRRGAVVGLRWPAGVALTHRPVFFFPKKGVEACLRKERKPLGGNRQFRSSGTDGGKTYLAAKINALMPPHLHYVEPYCGGCAVLLAHSGEGRSELINDINGALMNFWDVLKQDHSFRYFKRWVEATPLSRDEFDRAHNGSREMEHWPRWRKAALFFVECRQSLAGRRKCFTPPTRTRLRRGMNGNVSEWLGAVDGLPAVHERLRRVFMESMDAPRLIQREDTRQTLFYCDPSYLPDTRTAPDVYEHEMTVEQHVEMLDVLTVCQGMVILSGYDSDLYRSRLANWNRHTFDLPNNAAGGRVKRRQTEVVWTNF